MADYGFHQGVQTNGRGARRAEIREQMEAQRAPAPSPISEPPIPFPAPPEGLDRIWASTGPRVDPLPGGYRPPVDPVKLTIPRGPSMDVLMIWVTDENPDSEIWLLEAWDNDSIAGNQEGWEEAVQKAYEVYGGANVRITKTTVDFDKVQAAFQPVDI